MRWIRDPGQMRMFDPFDGVLSEMARQRILAGWQGVFRAVVLKLLPVRELARHFSADRGCPTKELYSMAGLVFLADFFDWNALDAADAYMMRSDVQFSLNIEPGAECSDRTVERYRKLFTEDDLASQLFRDLTIKLTDLLELNVSKQRLDSTHLFSHMATFGRVRLMAVTVKRCLTQIKRHAAEDYEALQLITGAIPETACANDSEAVRPMLEQLDANGLTPEQMLADTAYGSDENYATAESFGVELVAPVPGRDPELGADELTLDDFAHNEVTGSVDACPAGHSPLQVTRDETTQTTTVFLSAATCASCPLLKLCPIQQTPDGNANVEFTDKARRAAARRCEEQTDVFRERYAQRSGIESTNSGLKNRLSLGWLHVRGRGAVFRAILLKVSGWNVLRTAASKKLCAMVQEKLAKLLGIGWTRPFGQVCRVPGLLASRLTRFQMRSRSILRRDGRSVELFENQRILTA